MSTINATVCSSISGGNGTTLDAIQMMNACNKLNEVKQKISEERKVGISSKVFPMLEQQKYYLAQIIRIGAEPYSTENSFVVANNYAFVHHLQSKIDCIPK